MMQVLPKSIDAGEVNLVILMIGVPVVSYIGRKLLKSIDALSSTVRTLHVTLLGTEDQGGLVRRVEGVAMQGHAHATRITALNIEVENIKERLK